MRSLQHHSQRHSFISSNPPLYSSLYLSVIFHILCSELPLNYLRMCTLNLSIDGFTFGNETPLLLATSSEVYLERFLQPLCMPSSLSQNLALYYTYLPQLLAPCPPVPYIYFSKWCLNNVLNTSQLHSQLRYIISDAAAFLIHLWSLQPQPGLHTSYLPESDHFRCLQTFKLCIFRWICELLNN